MENNKRIFFLKGKDNEPFEQAIFILKGNKSASLVNEAERIIESCMSNKSFYAPSKVVQNAKTTKKTKGVSTDSILNIGIVISFLLLAATLCTLML